MAETFPGPRGYSERYEEDKYIGYYNCADPKFPCPKESDVPGWKIISNKVVGIGVYNTGCPKCIVTEIIWQRIGIPVSIPEQPFTPVPVSVPIIKKTVKLSYTAAGEKSYGGWSINGGAYSQYGTIDLDYAERKFGGTGEIALRNWLVKSGIDYNYFTLNDTIYDKNGNLVTEISPLPSKGIPVSIPEHDCVHGTTRQVPCPQDPTKLVTQECMGGNWITRDVECITGNATDFNIILKMILFLAIVIMIYYMTARK